MNKMQNQVRDFHAAFGIPIAHGLTLQNDGIRVLRVELIREEFNEFVEALQTQNIVETADALADMLYVIFGAGVSFGMDLENIFNEVHRSNMSKVGGHMRDDGKWIKPDSYSKADIATALAISSVKHFDCPCSICR